ncbi:MAG TPA: hypothetical protein VFR18_13055, partial [Terriglobia bacterium]|nr:hypothetical protein [Terriglobia bacterium]
MKWRCTVAALLLIVVTAIPILAQRGAARPQVTPPDGPVWQVLRKNCSGCHGIDDNAFHALDRAGWQSLLEAKHKDRKVVLTGNDQELLLDWLVSKFGPASRPFP